MATGHFCVIVTWVIERHAFAPCFLFFILQNIRPKITVENQFLFDLKCNQLFRE